jgi:twitching motility protein PilT
MAVIDTYFQELQEKGGSDLHMIVGFPPLIREKGELVALDHPELTAESNREVLTEILDEEQRRALDEEKDLDMAYELEGVGRFRCNFFFQHRGLNGIFRLIPTEIMSIETLNLPEATRAISMYNKGLVLVTGPTGSGKSTTLAAMINHINENRQAHIITIEDPLEFVHQNKSCIFTQREIGTHAHSFADALKVASREDPDVILVGEMRDLETISLALTCAELGILVFGTLHTNSAAKTIDRIIDAFPSDQQAQVRTMLAESLQAVVAQQLMKKADGRGRCAANEILIGTSALASIVREGKISQIHSLIQSNTRNGMQTIDQHLQQLVEQGMVTREAALEKAENKELFR